MKKISFSPLFAAVLYLVSLPLLSQAADPISEQWLGVYMAGQKMGYMRITTEATVFEDKPGYKITSFIRTKMVLLGSTVQQDISTSTYTDQQMTPVFQSYDMASGGERTRIEARYFDREIKCKVVTANGESEKTVEIPEGVSLVSDSMYAVGSGEPQIGRKTSTRYFNPMTLTIDTATSEVLHKEKVEVGGKTYNTYAVKSSTGSMGGVTTWQTADGTIIKSVANMGLTMLIESAQDAVNGIDENYTPPDDFVVATGVRANIDLPNPRSIKKLKVKLSGKIEPRMAISDHRQTAKWLEPKGDERSAEFVITARKFDGSKSAKLPVTDDAVAEYLKATTYLQSDAWEIRGKAKQIVGQEKSAFKAASKIQSWVYGNMKPRTDIGIARPAVDVLKNKAGVCRDYAILYASLARAAGIPTRIVAGLVYMNGSFYYHAWAESFVGEWVAFDPTQNKSFVDATHIKLTEGDATNMFEMAPVFGSLRADIEKYE